MEYGLDVIAFCVGVQNERRMWSVYLIYQKSLFLWLTNTRKNLGFDGKSRSWCVDDVAVIVF